MLTEIFENIREKILELPEFSTLPDGRVNRYHGEFEDGFDWVPVLPTALIYINNSRPLVNSNDMLTQRTITQLIIYVADRNDSLGLAEAVANQLDGAEFEIDQCNYFTTYRSLEFFGYIKAVEIYKITVDVK